MTAGLVGLSVLAAAYAAEGPRTAAVKDIMGGIVGPNFGSLNMALRGELTDETKAAALRSAALLNEASHVLVDNQRSKGEPWNAGAAGLRTNSAMVTEKLNAGDVEAARAAAMQIGAQGCRVCHSMYRN